MKYTIFALLLLSLTWSCTSEEGQQKIQGKVQQQSNYNFQQYFDNIAEVDNCLAEGEAFDVLGRRLDAVVKVPMYKLEEASMIKQFYYEANQRQATAPPRKSGRCVDIYISVKGRVLQKLSTMNSNEAAADALIELYQDKNLAFEGGEGKSLRRAMVVYGKSILEKLTPIQNERPQIGPLVVQELQAQ